MLGWAFVWGATVSAGGAIVFENLGQRAITALAGPSASATFGPLMVTPFVEEGLKGLLLVILLIVARHRLHGLVNVVVFGGVAGAGFAFTENTLYLGRAVITFLDSAHDVAAISVLAVTLVLRVLMVPFMHSFFVSVTGIGVLLAARRRSVPAQVGLVALGYVVAMGLHGIWDFAGLAAGIPTLIYVIYATVMVPLFVVLCIAVLVARARQGRTIRAGLAGLVDEGVIEPGEVEPLSGLASRRRQRRSAAQAGGRAAAAAVRAYQSAVSTLTILQAGLPRAARSDAADAVTRQRELVVAAREAARS